MTLDRKLCGAIDEVLTKWRDEAGVETWKKFCERSGIAHPKLSEVLNGRRGLTERFANQLLAALGKGSWELAEAVANRFVAASELRVGSLSDDPPARTGADYVGEFTRRIRDLQAGDEYVLVTMEPPLELTRGPVQDLVVAAASEGVEFRYIFPHGDGQPSPSRLQSSLDAYAAFVGGTFLDIQFNDWRDSLVGRAEAEQARVIESGITMHTARLNLNQPFLSMGCKYTLIRSGFRGSPPSKGPPASIEAFIELRHRPFGEPTADDLIRGAPRAFLRLEERLAQVLDLWCRSVMA